MPEPRQAEALKPAGNIQANMPASTALPVDCFEGSGPAKQAMGLGGAATASAAPMSGGPPIAGIGPDGQLKQAGTSIGVLSVNVPEGMPWKVSSDQAWAQPYAVGNAPGTVEGSGPDLANVMFRANAGTEPREATLSFTGPNGELLGTQKVVQPPASSPLEMAALGDSYMAGIGAGKHDSTVESVVKYMGSPNEYSYPYVETDKTGRTDKAWARLLEGDARINVNMGSHFFAETGGTTDGFDLRGAKSEPSINTQFENNKAALLKADVMLLTAGGNDALFGDLARAGNTITGGDAKFEKVLKEANTLLKEGLAPKLETTYKAALEAAPNATIYVSGYPFSDTSQQFGGVPASREPAVKDYVNNLNSTIQSTIDKVNAENPNGPRLVYMPPIDEPSTLNAIKLVGARGFNSMQSFHPNARGNELWAQHAAEFLLGNK